jgi:hypothetical protein
MINLGASVDCGAFVSEKFSHHFAPKGYSAESLLCAYPNSNFELFEPAAHRRVMHSQMFGDRLQPIAVSVVEKIFGRTLPRPVSWKTAPECQRI